MMELDGVALPDTQGMTLACPPLRASLHLSFREYTKLAYLSLIDRNEEANGFRRYIMSRTRITAQVNT